MTLNGNWRRESGESRTEEFRAWRTVCGFGACGDIDQIEYLASTGRPILFLELSVADRRSEAIPAGIPKGCPPSRAFLEKVEHKASRQRPYGKLLDYLKEQLEGVPTLLVVFIKGELESAGVWVKRRDSNEPWQALSLVQFERRLRATHEREERRECEGERSTGTH